MKKRLLVRGIIITIIVIVVMQWKGVLIPFSDFKYLILVKSGWKLENKGMNDNAIQIAKKAVKISPSRPEAHHLLGYIYSQKGHYTEAIKEYKKISSNYSDYEAVSAGIGFAYLMKLQINEGILWCKKAITLNLNSIYYYWIGYAYYYANEWEKAFYWFNYFLTIGQQQEIDYLITSHFFLGECYSRLKEYHKAIKEYQKVLSLLSGKSLKIQGDFKNIQLFCQYYVNHIPKYIQCGKIKIINIPHLSYNSSYSCGAMALATIMNYYRYKVTIEEIDSNVVIDGISVPAKMLSYAKDKGFLTYIYKTDLQHIKKYIDKDMPIIVYFQKDDYGHMSVIKGYDDIKGSIITREFPFFYNSEEIPYSVFLKQWEKTNNWMLLIIPPSRVQERVL